MLRRTISTGAAVVVALSASIGVAQPVLADEPAADSEARVIPDVREMTLGNAVEEIVSATSPVEPKFRYRDLHNNQVVINMSNWVVCYTWPDEITSDSRTVLIGVSRPTVDCW